MLTLEKLRQFGANVDEGLMRCMNNEAFYLKLVEKVTADTRLAMLEKQLSEKDLDAAFETAHALKGMHANLALEPIAEPIGEMTELLRVRTDTDYSALLEKAKAQFEKLCSL